MKKHQAKDVNFYVLALLQEDSSYKEQDLMVIDGKEYGIHGLWPQITKNSYPQYCDTTLTFNEDALKPIKNQLNIFWHSNQKSNEYFWQHEWLKHGTCTNPLMCEFDFFSQVIKLYTLVKRLHNNNDIVIQDYVEKSESLFLIPFDLKFKLLSPCERDELAG